MATAIMILPEMRQANAIPHTEDVMETPQWLRLKPFASDHHGLWHSARYACSCCQRGGLHHQQLFELRPTLPPLSAPNGNRDGLALAD